jgi:hypothetical protein
MCESNPIEIFQMTAWDQFLLGKRPLDHGIRVAN